MKESEGKTYCDIFDNIYCKGFELLAIYYEAYIVTLWAHLYLKVRDDTMSNQQWFTVVKF